MCAKSKLIISKNIILNCLITSLILFIKQCKILEGSPCLNHNTVRRCFYPSSITLNADSFCNGIMDCLSQEDENPFYCYHILWPSKENCIISQELQDVIVEYRKENIDKRKEICDHNKMPIDKLNCNLINKNCIMTQKVLYCYGMDSNFDIPAMFHYLSFKGLNFQKYKLNIVSPTIKLLIFRVNNVRDMGSFLAGKNIIVCDISDNKITRLLKSNFINSKIKFLHIDNNLLNYLEAKTFENLDIIELKLSNNKLESLGDSPFDSDTLQSLNLDNNYLNEIKSPNFNHMPMLKYLFLSNNRIKSFDSSVFLTSNLIHLDLSNNILSSLSQEFSKHLPNLRELSLKGNKFSLLYDGYFGSMLNHIDLLKNPHIAIYDQLAFHKYNLKSVYVDTMDICLYMKINTKCIQFGVESYFLYDNFKDFLSKYSRNLLATLCMINLLITAIFAYYTIMSNHFFIKIITINYGFASIFTLMHSWALLINDSINRGYLREKALTWMRSKSCTSMGICGTLGLELSLITTLLLTLARYDFLGSQSWSEPMEYKKRRMKIGVLFSWCVSISIAISPALWESWHPFYGKTEICYSLYIFGDDLPGKQYANFVFLFNGCVISLICILNFVLFVKTQHEISEARRLRQETKLKKQLRKQFNKELLRIIVIEVIWWFPFFSVKLLHWLEFFKFSRRVESSIVIVMLPLYSIMVVSFSIIDYLKRSIFLYSRTVSYNKELDSFQSQS